MAISTKTRFEVFKRDKFACQYCGAKAPDALLHVDHIEPQSKGGTDDLLNLITSCAKCNLGKGARRLSDDSAIAKQVDQLAALEERQQQLAMMLEWQRSLVNLDDEMVAKIDAFWFDMSGWCLSESAKNQIRKWVRQYSLEEVLTGIRLSAQQYGEIQPDGYLTRESADHAFKKIGGVCRVRRAEQTRPWLKDLLYIRGIVRNRCPNYFQPHVAMEYLEDAYKWAGSVTDMASIARGCRNWTDWRDDMEQYIADLKRAVGAN